MIVEPKSYALAYQPSSMAELGTVRQALSDSNTMLVVTTGQWNGELGSSAANAWSVMPPTGPFGVVLEQSVAYYGGLIAHELGHYLNLQHVNDAYNVMNPVIYSNSFNLLDNQCTEARATAISFWNRMLR